MAEGKAGILVRVSDPGQQTDNQVPDLVAWAERRGLAVVVIYQFQESTWKGAHQKQFTQVYRDPREGKFQVLLVWALAPIAFLVWKRGSNGPAIAQEDRGQGGEAD